MSRARIRDVFEETPMKFINEGVDEEKEISNLKTDAGLVLSGQFCGGRVNDLKRKAPWFLSDFKNAFSPQSIAVIFFVLCYISTIYCLLWYTKSGYKESHGFHRIWPNIWSVLCPVF